MLIDSHVHVGKWKYFDDCGKVYWSFRDIVSCLVSRGFTGAVLMPSELKCNRELMEEITALRKNNDSFHCWFFPWLNPRREDDLDFVRTHIEAIDGFKFHPSLDRVRFGASEHHGFLELARAHCVPILVHCGAWLEMSHYRFVLDVAEQYPDVNFILAHQGGTTYELKIAATKEIKDRGLLNIYLDTAGTHEYWLLEWCVEHLGADRFLLGSDFPLKDASLYVTFIQTTRLSHKQHDLIAGENLWNMLAHKRVRSPSHAFRRDLPGAELKWI